MLRIESVSTSYPGALRPSLNRVDFNVGAGEVVALLGPSGSGKTTLLQAIAGLLPIDHGRVVLAGRDMQSIPTHRRGVGLMFQDFALFPHRTVAGNVGFGLEMAHESPTDREVKVDAMLDLVGLTGFGQRSISTLSGGQRQRGALARALAATPQILMLDEPLGALDPMHRETLVRDLSQVFAKTGLSVLYVTHDQAEAFEVADRVVIMNDGCVERIGEPQVIWSYPKSPFVARFLGFTNVFDAEVFDGRAYGPWGSCVVASTPPGLQPILIRPDDVELVDDHRPGAISVSVAREVFRGDHMRISLELPGGSLIDMDRHITAEARHERGERVHIFIHGAEYLG